MCVFIFLNKFFREIANMFDQGWANLLPGAATMGSKF